MESILRVHSWPNFSGSPSKISGKYSSREAMFAGLQPYPRMKDSGVDWLGEVPAHWGVRRLRSATSILNGATPSTSREDYWDGHVLWITPDDLGALQGQRVIDSVRKITAEGHASCGTSLGPRNSVVISTRAPIGHLGILESAGCTNQGCKLLVPRSDIVSEYLYAVLESACSELQSLGQGTTFAELSRAKLGSFRLSIPPLSEQTAIARFLAHANSRIERYIRAKEKLIALLEGQKQVIVRDAVTGRLDVRTGQPYAAYKPSGVEWLGDVPAHWEVRRLRVAASILNGATPSTGRKEYWDGDILWVTPEDLGSLQGQRVTESARKITAEGHASCGTSLGARNSIVISTRAPIGHLGILASAGCTNQGCKLLTPNAEITSEYLYRVLQSARSELQSLGQGTTFAELSKAKLGSFRLLVPPLPEQTAIARYLDDAIGNIASAIEHTNREIALLREYRTRLIADVVTGKLDVREAAAELPEVETCATNVASSIERDANDVVSGGEAKVLPGIAN